MINTIVAIATPLLKCPIHIIRISGPETFNILNKILKKPVEKKANSIQYNFILDENKKVVDEVLLNVFLNPNSFTGEDVVEINCHGNPIVSKKILNLLIINGAKQAKPGEFSMQALINNKMNYYEIEAMNNLINANNNVATDFAINALIGKDNDKIEQLKEEIFKITGSIEVNIDYPEYDDVPQYNHSEIIALFRPIYQQLKTIYETSKILQPIFNGLKITIIGKPNVGKSSLLNLLSKKDKAIVSNIEGTTRDIVESHITFDGINLILLDTAGIRKSSDAIEKIGIDKTKEAIKQADLVIWLLDQTETEKEIEDIKNLLKNKNYLKVFNKADVKRKNNEINISVINQDINELIEAIKEQLNKLDYNNLNQLVLQSERQLNLLLHAIYTSEELLNNLENNEPLDLLQSYFEIVINDLNEILGKQFEYDKLDELFKHFCLGK